MPCLAGKGFHACLAAVEASVLSLPEDETQSGQRRYLPLELHDSNSVIWGDGDPEASCSKPMLNVC